MKRTLLIWASMACMTVHSVMAQDAAVNKIIEIGQTDNQVMDHLDVLTNRIGGRVIGSNAYDMISTQAPFSCPFMRSNSLWVSGSCKTCPRCTPFVPAV